MPVCKILEKFFLGNRVWGKERVESGGRSIPHSPFQKMSNHYLPSSAIELLNGKLSFMLAWHELYNTCTCTGTCTLLRPDLARGS